MIEDFNLFILMRQDMDSMNPGKCVAQGAHAANQFVKLRKKHTKEYHKWAGNLGYGTTICLSASKEDIDRLMGDAAEDGYEYDQVIDETYPLKDGKTTHYFPCLTCAYVFAPRKYHKLKHLELMK